MKSLKLWQVTFNAYREFLKDKDSLGGVGLFILVLLIFLILTVFLVIGSGFLPEPPTSQDPTSPVNFLWLLGNQMGGNIGQLIQATLGVAATLGGAVVSLIISLSALKLAKQAVALTSAEQQREVEKYSRVLILELEKGSRSLEDVNRKMMNAYSVISSCELISCLFYSRIVARESIIVNNAASNVNLTLNAVEHDEKLDTSEVQKIINDFSKIGILLEDNKYFSTFGEFLEIDAISSEIDECRVKFINALESLAKFIDEIQQSEFVRYIYEENISRENQFYSLTKLKNIILLKIKSFQDKEKFIQAAAVALHFSRQANSWPEIDENGSYAEIFEFDNTVEFAFLCYILRVDDGQKLFNIFSIPKVNDAIPNSLMSLFSIYSHGLNVIEKIFNTVSGSESNIIPRPLTHYKPDLYSIQQVNSIGHAMVEINSILDALSVELDMDDPNDFAVYERSVKYWLSNGKKYFGI
jgi:hypothetical protein